MADAEVWVVKDPRIAAYGFGEGHPFGPDRHDRFHEELAASGIAASVQFVEARLANDQELAAFHTRRYIDYVRDACAGGQLMLDKGDTPAFEGLFEAASWVAGGTLVLLEAIMTGKARRGFIPIGGLHHAGRDHTAGFCVFNDCGIAAELLRQQFGLNRQLTPSCYRHMQSQVAVHLSLVMTRFENVIPQTVMTSVQSITEY